MYTIVKSNRITSFDNKLTIRPVVVSREFAFSRNAYKQYNHFIIYTIFVLIIFIVIKFQNCKSTNNIGISLQNYLQLYKCLKY